MILTDAENELAIGGAGPRDFVAGRLRQVVTDSRRRARRGAGAPVLPPPRRDARDASGGGGGVVPGDADAGFYGNPAADRGQVTIQDVSCLMQWVSVLDATCRYLAAQDTAKTISPDGLRRYTDVCRCLEPGAAGEGCTAPGSVAASNVLLRKTTSAYLHYGESSAGSKLWEDHMDLDFDGKVSLQDALVLIRALVGKRALVKKVAGAAPMSLAEYSTPSPASNCFFQAAVTVFVPSSTLPFCVAVGGAGCQSDLSVSDGMRVMLVLTSADPAFAPLLNRSDFGASTHAVAPGGGGVIDLLHDASTFTRVMAADGVTVAGVELRFTTLFGSLFAGVEGSPISASVAVAMRAPGAGTFKDDTAVTYFPPTAPMQRPATGTFSAFYPPAWSSGGVVLQDGGVAAVGDGAHAHSLPAGFDASDACCTKQGMDYVGWPAGGLQAEFMSVCASRTTSTVTTTTTTTATTAPLTDASGAPIIPKKGGGLALTDAPLGPGGRAPGVPAGPAGPAGPGADKFRAGNVTATTTAEVPEANQAASSGDDLIVVWILLVLVVILIVVAILWKVNKDQKAKEAETEAAAGIELSTIPATDGKGFEAHRENPQYGSLAGAGRLNINEVYSGLAPDRIHANEIYDSSTGKDARLMQNAEYVTQNPRHTQESDMDQRVAMANATYAEPDDERLATNATYADVGPEPRAASGGDGLYDTVSANSPIPSDDGYHMPDSPSNYDSAFDAPVMYAATEGDNMGGRGGMPNLGHDQNDVGARQPRASTTPYAVARQQTASTTPYAVAAQQAANTTPYAVAGQRVPGSDNTGNDEGYLHIRSDSAGSEAAFQTPHVYDVANQTTPRNPYAVAKRESAQQDVVPGRQGSYDAAMGAAARPTFGGALAGIPRPAPGGAGLAGESPLYVDSHTFFDEGGAMLEEDSTYGAVRKLSVLKAKPTPLGQEPHNHVRVEDTYGLLPVAVDLYDGAFFCCPPIVFMVGDNKHGGVGKVLRAEYSGDEKAFIDLASGDVFAPADSAFVREVERDLEALEDGAATFTACMSPRGRGEDQLEVTDKVSASSGTPLVRATNGTNTTAFRKVPIHMRERRKTLTRPFQNQGFSHEALERSPENQTGFGVRSKSIKRTNPLFQRKETKWSLFDQAGQVGPVLPGGGDGEGVIVPEDAYDSGANFRDVIGATDGAAGAAYESIALKPAAAVAAARALSTPEATYSDSAGAAARVRGPGAIFFPAEGELLPDGGDRPATPILDLTDSIVMGARSPGILPGMLAEPLQSPRGSGERPLSQLSDV